jgi:hypothetical protein
MSMPLLKYPQRQQSPLSKYKPSPGQKPDIYVSNLTLIIEAIYERSSNVAQDPCYCNLVVNVREVKGRSTTWTPKRGAYLSGHFKEQMIGTDRDR